eukprot:TRINITY_DN1642_c0_g1_i1.p1 TRINITY_DN1642_c0_g1~~TRINITY_DN1642_c0_g1_i1.p1  ORF type:complete len:378 (-),score=54.39 TRINITY_DN1642_c0_g1_i1:107-1240(-)
MGSGASSESHGGSHGGESTSTNTNGNTSGNGNASGNGNGNTSGAIGPPKSLSEGFWPAGWLNPGDLGTPLFEVWPDKYTPSAFHQGHGGAVVFGKDLHFAKQTPEPKTCTRFNSQDRLFGTAFLKCRLSRFCVGYKRPAEMWRPLHHFCYLNPTQGAWVAYYLYVDNKAVCPSMHRVKSDGGKAAANNPANHAANHAAGSDATGGHEPKKSGSADLSMVYDQDEVEVISDGEDEDEERIDPFDVFSTAFFVYRIPHEDLATTTTLPIILVPDPDLEAQPPPQLRQHVECWVRFARLLCALPAGIHRFSLEVRVLFEDGNKHLIGYHPASKTVAENFMQGENYCLGPSEVLAAGDFTLNVNRRDRKTLLTRARVETTV